MSKPVLSLSAESRQVFSQLAEELKDLAPFRDGAGRLQFRLLETGEKPLNRWSRRYIARQLMCSAGLIEPSQDTRRNDAV